MIDGPDNLLDFGNSRRSIFAAAQQKGSTAPRSDVHLKHRVIDHRGRVGVERRTMHIRGNSDDRKKSAIAPIEAPPKRILPWKILRNKCLTHDRHGHSIRSVLVAEVASTQE